jgi:hypothetical protein
MNLVRRTVGLKDSETAAECFFTRPHISVRDVAVLEEEGVGLFVRGIESVLQGGEHEGEIH